MENNHFGQDMHRVMSLPNGLRTAESEPKNPCDMQIAMERKDRARLLVIGRRGTNPRQLKVLRVNRARGRSN